MKLVVLFCIVLVAGFATLCCSSTPETFNQCTVQCSSESKTIELTTTRVEEPDPEVAGMIRGKSGPRGKPGVKGQPGKTGAPGKSCDLEAIKRLEEKLFKMEGYLQELRRSLKPRNCSEIMDSNPKTHEGIYKIYDNDSDHRGRRVYCKNGQKIDFLHDCGEVLQNDDEAASGVYAINPDNGVPDNRVPDNGVPDNRVPDSRMISAYCDMNTTGGGWTVFQTRFNGSENFDRNFEEYIDGFGSALGEHWLGLDALHSLTSSGDYQLRVELVSSTGGAFYAQYNQFSVGGAPGFVLSVGDFQSDSTTGDSLSVSSGAKFSTPDRDQDGKSDENCAGDSRNGAWWYNIEWPGSSVKSCHNSLSNLNAFEYGNISDEQKRVFWYKNHRLISMNGTKMMIRRN